MHIKISEGHNQEMFVLWKRKTLVMGYTNVNLAGDSDFWKSTSVFDYFCKGSDVLVI